MEYDLRLSPTMKALCTEQTKHISFESPAIHLDGNVDANLPLSSREESKYEATKETPTVHPDGQTSKSEAQATAHQVGNSRPSTPASYGPCKPVVFIESTDWLPEGWLTEVRIREGGSSAGNKDKFYYDPVARRQFRSKKEVLNFLETGKRNKRRPKMSPEGKFGDETKDLSGTTSEFCSSASHIAGISLETEKLFKRRPKMKPEVEVGYETKGLSGTTSELNTSASNIGGISLKAGKQYKRRPNMNPDGEFGDETKDLSGTISEFYSSASNIGGVSLEKRYKRRLEMNREGEVADETKDFSRTTSQFYSSASCIGGISPDGATRPFSLSSSSCSMPSSITGSSGLLVQKIHTVSLPCYTSPMVTVIHQSGPVNNVSIPTGTPLSRLHDLAASENTFNSDTNKRQLIGSSDWLPHSNHTAFLPSNSSPMAAIVHQLAAVNNASIPTATPISRFHDSASSHSTINSDTVRRQSSGTYDLVFHNKHNAPLTSHPSPMPGFTPQLGAVSNASKQAARTVSHLHYLAALAASQSTINSDTIRRQLSGTYDLVFHNNHTAPLTSHPIPLLDFTPQLGVVNNASIPAARTISHLHYSDALQSANNPDDIRRPTKFRWVLNGLEGSQVPIFTNEKPIESCNEGGEPSLDLNR